VSLLSAFATRSVTTLPEPADPRATAASVPTTTTPTAAMSRLPCFLFILGMILLAFLSLASLLIFLRCMEHQLLPTVFSQLSAFALPTPFRTRPLRRLGGDGVPLAALPARPPVPTVRRRRRSRSRPRGRGSCARSGRASPAASAARRPSAHVARARCAHLRLRVGERFRRGSSARTRRYVGAGVLRPSERLNVARGAMRVYRRRRASSVRERTPSLA